VEPKSHEAKQSAHPRLLSLDALRGADMLCIVGFDQIIHAAPPTESWLHRQFTHVPWDGFHFYDLVFPLLLFLIGVSLSYSLSSREELQSRSVIYRHIAQCAAILLFFGILINGKLLTYDPSQFQLTYSVLQVLAIGYVVASLLVLHCNIRQQIIATAALLIGYWFLMTLVPGHQIGVYATGANFGDWLNDLILGEWQKRWRFGWILQSLTYGANAMIGVLAGHLLRSQIERKTLALLALGVGSLLLGWLGCFSFSACRRTLEFVSTGPLGKARLPMRNSSYFAYSRKRKRATSFSRRRVKPCLVSPLDGTLDKMIAIAA
jgi:predicted acyltransferase